ncbi:tRNA lysidine(34) synthetase TilS [Aeromicrobium erythreum]|uniref:tRNA(Ile)-lysidine synthase n=1 Tax=Aeromicrobium erythreum TaxID=2041 RepID=A0A0U4CLX2_9ACTN|nr:tRNA lysidine(34) synthetase TilS [Aeromicrobium erythreum]ALX03708.1 tRNA(Ile)-lysidine synthetase [Aeromicrobium erythreum]
MRLLDAEARGRTGVRAVLADLDGSVPVVLGVSGGADSLALAACAAFVADRDRRPVRAVVVDHGLQAASTDVADRAADQVRGLGLPAEVVRVVVGSAGGPEGAARSARRAALLDAAGPEGVVLLAHTLDDQAETVLLGLGRGSGPRSLAGMAAVDGPWRRPFLGLRRADTEAVCTARDLRWWDDPHNRDPALRRVRVRHEVLPLLDDVLGGGVAEALARTADQLRDDTALLDTLAGEVADPADVATLAALPPALRSRVLRRLAHELGARPGELAASHLAALDRLVTDWRGQDRVELPGHVAVRRADGRLHGP